MEEITCSQCDHINPKNSNYCCECGHALDEETQTIIDKAKPEIDHCIAEAKKAIDITVEEARITTYERIQTDIVKWAKFQIGTFFAIITLILSIAGYQSYSTVTELKQLADDADKDIHRTMEDIKDKKNEFNNTYSIASKELDEKILRINQINLEEIENNQKLAAKLVSSSKELREDLNNAILDAQTLTNSKFKIALHYPKDNEEKRNSNIVQLINTLTTEGYVLPNNQISNLSVDRREIIAYTDYDYNKANEILSLIKKDYPELRVIRGNYDYTNDFNILIKLCTKIKTSSGECQ